MSREATRARGHASPEWARTVAVFGGRFDPPHRGHFEAVRGLFSEPGVREVWLLPCPSPAHKPAVAPSSARTEMARIGLLGAHPPGGLVRLDLRELDRVEKQPGSATYTFDTLHELRRECANIAFTVGVDQLEQLPTWHRFPDVLGLSHWIVVARRPAGMDRAQTVLREWQSSGLAAPTAENGLWELSKGSFLKVVPTSAPEMSSTAIREALARSGEAPEGCLEPAVLAYLKQNGLYGTGWVGKPHL